MNPIDVEYAQTGKSSNTNELGMREMQAMVYVQRHRQHLLVKAPPASGKSRAMMFVALDKLANQGVKKLVCTHATLLNSLMVLMRGNSTMCSSASTSFITALLTRITALVLLFVDYSTRHRLTYSP